MVIRSLMLKVLALMAFVVALSGCASNKQNNSSVNNNYSV
jgi:ABC-type uncharacterized transport system auxiliary subunit